jgi:hypothetical protein
MVYSNLSESSKEGYGSKRAVLLMMMMMMILIDFSEIKPITVESVALVATKKMPCTRQRPDR